MADRITGFYKALDNILGTFGIQNKLSDELLILKSKLKDTTNELEISNNSLMSATQDRDILRNDYIELNDIKSDLTKQREKANKIFKEKFVSMQKELTEAIESRDHYKSKQEESEKKYFDISEEFKKFRQKMKLKYSKVEDNEEKFCKNCQKSYFNSENFNWSCRTHSSKLCGDTYWCCGKVGKDSIGCIVSKHISKDEEDLSDNEKSGAASKFCSACKSMGHTLATCHRDPNLKTNADLAEEKKRLKDIRRFKKKTSQSFEIQGKISVMLSNKSMNLHESYLNFDEDDILFDDLNEIKEEVDFEDALSNNRVIIEHKNLKSQDTKKPSKIKSGLTVFTNLGYES